MSTIDFFISSFVTHKHIIGYVLAAIIVGFIFQFIWCAAYEESKPNEFKIRWWYGHVTLAAALLSVAIVYGLIQCVAWFFT